MVVLNYLNNKITANIIYTIFVISQISPSIYLQYYRHLLGHPPNINRDKSQKYKILYNSTEKRIHLHKYFTELICLLTSVSLLVN